MPVSPLQGFFVLFFEGRGHPALLFVFSGLVSFSRFLEDDQSFADKEKLARYGLYHCGRLPLLLVFILILNAVIKYFPILLGYQHIIVSTAQNYPYILLLCVCFGASTLGK